MSDIEYSVITSDVIKSFECTSIGLNTVKPVLSGHLLTDKRKILMTDGSSMKVESIAECSPWSILQYFLPVLSKYRLYSKLTNKYKHRFR